jgi:hypothetical protein
MSRPEDEGGFLGRWARRKQEARREDAAKASPPPIAAEPAPRDVDPPLPSLDDVLPGGDLSAFLQSHVPAALKNAALRKMWESDPTISGFIEMAENQWDFNAPDAIPGFASSIGDLDAKKLVDGLFSLARHDSARAPETSGETAGMPAASLPEPDADSLESRCDIADFQAENAAVGTSPQEAADVHVAAQKSPDESSVYDFRRRRHGGALPT